MPLFKRVFSSSLTNNLYNSTLTRIMSPGHYFLQRKSINDRILAAHIANLKRIKILFLRKKKKRYVQVITFFIPSTNLLREDGGRNLNGKKFNLSLSFPRLNPSNVETYNHSINHNDGGLCDSLRDSLSQLIRSGFFFFPDTN